MSADIEINVLGDLLVVRDGKPVELPPSRKTRALLAYLAVVQRPQRRERLCEMFWEVPDDPRGALRWSLSKIRGILNDGTADIFSADRNFVAILPEAIKTDFSKVRTLVRGGIAGLGRDELQAVAEGFRGLFLDDLSLPRCRDFEAWRVSFVNDMELLRLKVLRRLVEELRGQPEAALRYAQQLLQLVPEEQGLPKLVAELGEAARRESATGMSASVSPAAGSFLKGSDSSAEVRYCTTRDGVRVAYALTGQGSPVVRAAHWMSHLRYDAESPVWRHWIHALSARNTLVRYDERGNGMSQWDVEDVGFEAMIADLESIVDASGFERVVLLGVSQGCAISVAYAVRHPERVLGLILYGGYVKGWRARGNPQEIALRQSMGTLMRQGWGKDDPLFRQLFTSVFIPGASRGQMDWFNELQRKTVTPENAYRLAESFADIDVSDILGRVAVPTLVLHARGDRVAPIESGRAFAAGIAGARFVELESNNHILLEDEPAFGEFIAEFHRFVAETATPLLPAKRLGLSAKRPLSILVADFVDSFADIESDDPEVFAETLEPVANAAVEVVRRHGGVVVDVREGVVTAAFGADRALEEHTVQACRAARAIRDGVLKINAGAVKVRIGIDAGEALVRAATVSAAGPLVVSGPVVKAASRLAGSLRRDVIALTARARESAGGFVSTCRLQQSDYPGFARDGPAFELLAENRALSRWYLRAREGLSPMIGRSSEFDRLATAWLRAREGQGQVVGIVGSPGVGKSRLVHEFMDSQALKAFTVIEAGAEEINEAVAYDLVKRILLSLFGLAGTEDEQSIARAVRRRTAELAIDEQLLTPVLYVLDQPVDDAHWRDTQAADRAKQIRDAFVVLLGSAAGAKPVFILVEDLHWADAVSCRALEELANALARQRVLLLTTYRPDFEPAWKAVPYFTETRLSPLPHEQGRELATALLGNDPSLSELHALVCERAEGVPLFIEEIVGQLVQTRRLGGKPGAMRVLERTHRLDIPATIQSVLAARIDRIDPVDRKLLQIASVIGAVSPRPLLQTLSRLGDALEPALARLKAAELLFESGSGGEVEYVFKHAMIKDATYASLAAEGRRVLHSDALLTLERLHLFGRSDQAERLAHHAVRAEDWPRAARWLVAAADRALERSAYPPAAEFLEQAIQAVDHLPSTPESIALAIDIRTRMRLAYMVTGQFDKAIARLDEAREFARISGDAARLADTLLHTSYVYSTFGRTPEALAAAEEARTVGTPVSDRHMAEADLAAAQAHMIVGAAQPSLKLLLPHVEDFTVRWADDLLGFLVTRSVWFLGSLASTRALLGNADEAEADIAEAIRLAERSARPIDRYAAAYFESLVRIVSGSEAGYLDKLKRLAEESRERAPFPFHPWLTATLGHAALGLGHQAEAVEALESAFDAAEQANMPHFMTYTSCMLAVAAARKDDPSSRDDLLDALDGTRRSGDRWVEFEVLMALGSIEDGESADRRFRDALLVARSSGYRPFATRASRRLKETSDKTTSLHSQAMK